jgi:Zn-dependent protease with chaperone function
MSPSSGTHSPGRPRIALAELVPEAYVYPGDRAALANLQRLPILPLVLRKFNDLALDRMYFVRNRAESIRCGPRQLPTLHRLLLEGCRVLRVAEPELYVRHDAQLHAATAGVARPFIVVSSTLLDQLDDDEILYVLGHELGHIQCGHVLYQMLGRFLVPVLDALGQATLGVGRLAGVGLLTAFYEWLRQAEFSCDRAGLLTCQDPNIAYSAILKLGAGNSRMSQELSVAAFLEQARGCAGEVAAAPPEALSRALAFLLYNWQLEHPQVVFRAHELESWVEEGAFAGLLERRGRPVQGQGPACGAAAPEEAV